MRTTTLLLLLFLSGIVAAQTSVEPTSQKMKNGEVVYTLSYNSEVVGQFLPIHQVKLVTKTTDPKLFEKSISQLQRDAEGTVTTPDGMTQNNNGQYIMQGKGLSNGKPCGDGIIYDYGIVYSVGKKITFTHKREQPDFERLYQTVQRKKGSLAFLPVIYRNGKSLSSNNTVDKVLVRRETYDGVQVGVIIFSRMVTYNEAKDIVLGMNRDNASTTTHIYVLDGGSTWGQSCKEVNGKMVVLGTRNKDKVTNYFVFN